VQAVRKGKGKKRKKKEKGATNGFSFIFLADPTIVGKGGRSSWKGEANSIQRNKKEE